MAKESRQCHRPCHAPDGRDSATPSSTPAPCCTRCSRAPPHPLVPTVAKALAHLASLLIAHQAVQVDGGEGRLACDRGPGVGTIEEASGNQAGPVWQSSIQTWCSTIKALPALQASTARVMHAIRKRHPASPALRTRELHAHHDHARHPKEQDIMPRLHHLGRVEAAQKGGAGSNGGSNALRWTGRAWQLSPWSRHPPLQVGRGLRPAERGKGPEAAAEPGVQNIMVLPGVGGWVGTWAGASALPPLLAHEGQVTSPRDLLITGRLPSSHLLQHHALSILCHRLCLRLGFVARHDIPPLLAAAAATAATGPCAVRAFVRRCAGYRHHIPAERAREMMESFKPV